MLTCVSTQHAARLSDSCMQSTIPAFLRIKSNPPFTLCCSYAVALNAVAYTVSLQRTHKYKPGEYISQVIVWAMRFVPSGLDIVPNIRSSVTSSQTR